MTLSSLIKQVEELKTNVPSIKKKKKVPVTKSGKTIQIKDILTTKNSL